MTSYGDYFKVKLLETSNIIIGTINNIFEYTILSVFNRNSRPVLFYQNENNKNIPLSQAYNRIYQQMEDVSLVGAQTSSSLINTTNSLGAIIRLSNYDRIASRYKVNCNGEFVSNSGGGEITFDFLLGSNIMISSGVISVPNLNGTGHWFVNLEFIVKKTGEAGVAILSANGTFEFTNKQGVEKLTAIHGINNTTFDTISELETDIQITTNGTIESYLCSDMVYYYLN